MTEEAPADETVKVDRWPMITPEQRAKWKRLHSRWLDAVQAFTLHPDRADAERATWGALVAYVDSQGLAGTGYDPRAEP